ncbi:alpha/beta-hydrolase [Trametes maxima]|nr:alpha/beta-hydrolase [Trametes maxima]
MNPDNSKLLTVSRGFEYCYQCFRAQGDKPTLFFLHGFPSTSFDWRKQIEYFGDLGYGILAPDLLGAGGTSKPEDPDAFRTASIAQDLIELLDAEGLPKVVGISHGWGSLVLSRLANSFEDRFLGFSFLAVPYFPPQVEPQDIDEVIERLIATTGDGRYGFWKYFDTEVAPGQCKASTFNFVNLMYPAFPQLWLTWLTPVGKTQRWMLQRSQSVKPPYMNQWEFAQVHEELRNNADFNSYFNYFKVAVRNLNVEDDRKIPPEDWVINKPVLFVAAQDDVVNPPIDGIATIAEFAPFSHFVELGTGHWAHLEEPEKVNAELQTWISERLGLPTDQEHAN